MDIRESLLDTLRRIQAYSRAEIHIKKALDEIDSADGPIERSAHLENLTPREKEIYQMLAQGLEPREIAEKLKRSLKTIEAQRDTLRKKLGFATAADLARAAREGKV
jgi:DNA-binding NarL/FixJ family response regulator